ncbi:cobaltochelatase subunit CobN [Azospira restricta]|uniref:Cobaltochelatase subunit CobN n=1 Tax=Azospira restricta TaxID=404405 RepID=A0A974SN01_9RHOO|nr:cobaltochelatase subunit CobN [Azospira restricta]QRJ63190.1 cobaltochelatase subunit CobN [Azospira restricta]
MPLARLLRLAAFAAALIGTAAEADTVLFVSTSPVPPGKFTKLAEIGAAHGFKVESRQAEKLPADPDASLWRGADAVFFDAPRDHLQDAVRAKLAKALPGLSAPHLWMHEAKPESRGFPKPVADRLHAYYVNGARPNFENFFRTLAAHRQGQPLDGIAPPVVFPKAAIYHPQAPGLVFADTAAYLKWKLGKREVDLAQKPPVIAVALHQTYVGSEQTAFVDDLIARIEAAGAVPLAWYAPVMGPQAGLLKVDGRLVADAIINTQIVLDPDGRRKELEALGIPVMQALSYRKGDEADWRADPQGVPLIDVPFFLAQGEYAGITDAVVAGAQKKGDDAVTAIAAQSAAVVAKAVNQVRLQRLPNADKKLAVMFWNYPPGEKNLSASYLNLPKSLAATLQALKAAGYDTRPEDEAVLINNLQRLLAPFYRDGQLPSLLRDGLAERLPVAAYRAWLATLPEPVRRELHERWGDPEQSAMVIRNDGAPYFVIPRFTAGKVVFTPQAPRGEKWEDKEKALYHSTKAVPSHYYLAQYLWAREQFKADALVHYGTHGSQEWLPGKERGLAMSDYPMLAVGNVPVIYPYIVDNIGEALQAKRRGRATIVTHQTPAFAPAGLHEATVKIHDLLHAWLAQDDGAVKLKLAADLRAAVKKERIDKDMGWSDARIDAEFRNFVDALHDHLHELAQTAQPLGLHTFGTAPQETHRLGTVLLMLGKGFWESAAKAAGVAADELDEMFVDSYEKTVEAPPFKLFRDWMTGKAAKPADARLAAQFEQGKTWYEQLAAAGEMNGLIAALAGKYLPTSYGGDPMKNPDALPTGRNLYGFDPSRVPTKQAWEAGKEAAEALLAAHRAKTGRTPKKLAFSLWSVETMRHQGMLEAQALWTMGVEPVWDQGGRVVDVQLVPREKLGRPRVDVVLSATGLYRDHFPNAMKQLAKAVQLAARADEADNPLFENSRAIAARLLRQGVPAAAAVKAAETRLFSSESGKYGTGLDDATLATDTWKGKAEGDRKLADLYLSRMQFAYGADEADWGAQGIAGATGKPAQMNLYAEHLKGTEGAVLSRTSNLYGMLTTDDPFQYLGGIGLAVRRLDGKAPELYISNLRGSGSGKVEGADAFLAKELATRNFHPGYIQGLMAEGYAGTLQVLDAMNNFSGWTIVAREIVRDDQWQEFVDVYVRDKHRLGLKQWFETHNPAALAQTIERMLEAARQGYWQADAKTLAELKERYRDLAQRHDVVTDNQAFKDFVKAGADANSGFGLAALLGATKPQQAADLTPPPAAPAPPTIEGMRLERVEEKQQAPALPFALLGIALLLLATLGGAARTLANPALRRVEAAA